MRISSLVCVAWMLLVQLSAADQPGAIPLPPGSQVPKAAQRAGEAPAWNPQAAAVTAAPQQQAQSVPAAAAPAAVNPNYAQPATIGAPATASVQAAPPGYSPAATAPFMANPAAPPPARPLFSVMKRKRQAAEAAAGQAAPQVSVPTNTAASAPSAPQFATPTNAAANTASQAPIAAANPAAAEPQPTTAPASAAPATLNTAQTEGALPIDAMPAPPSETATPVAAEPPASPVIPAGYTETIASPTSLATPNFTAPSAAEVAQSASESSPARSVAEPTASVMIPSAAPRSETTSQPTLHPTAPVQLIAPPDESAQATSSISDPQVTPADSRPPATDSSDDTEQLAAAHAAADLFNQSLVTSANVKLTGKWVSLASIMNGLSESQRLAAVNAYWQLSSAVSNLIWQTDELDRLDKAAPARVLIDNPMISTARAMATARIDEAQLKVSKSQQTLARILGASESSTAILPSDRPLVGPYHTQFQAIFANRQAPARAREIDTALPILLRIINDHAAAVRSAMDAVHWAEETRARGETDVRTVLACQEDLRRQRRDFLAAVLNYNLEIAEYASAVAAPGTPDEKFVSMLIRPKSADRLSAIPERSTFATPMAPLPSLPSSSSPRELSNSGQRSRTASDGWVPSSVRPLEAPAPPSEDSKSPAAAPQAAMPSVVNPIKPLGKQSDPFAPSGGDRYGDRYNNRYNENR